MRHQSKLIAVGTLVTTLALVVAPPASPDAWDKGGVPFRTEANTVRQFCKILRANDQDAARAHGTKLVRFRCGKADFPRPGRYTWVALFERYRDSRTPVWALYRLDFGRGKAVAWSTVL